MKRVLFVFGFLVVVLMLGTNSGYAAVQSCAIINGGSTLGGGPPLPAYLTNQHGQDNEGCNVLITFNANGSITTTNPNAAASYDTGGDDNLVGIINNTGHAITSVFLSSATVDIFGFDGDGVCDGYTFGPGGPTFTCPAGGGYGPTGVTFSGINGAQTSGTVNFGGAGIAAGSTGFFSLEGPVAIDLVVNGPEPSSLLLLGVGLLGLGGAVQRRLKTRA